MSDVVDFVIEYQPMEARPHLYIIPIVHTYADMGSLKDKIPVDERYEAVRLPDVLQDFYSWGRRENESS